MQPPEEPPARGRRSGLAGWPAGAGLLGLASLFSGVALLLTILLAVSLPLGLIVGGSAAAAVGIALRRRAPAVDRRAFRRILLAGLVGGLLATLCYDVFRHFVSLLDPVRYDPLLAVNAFGALLLGDGAPPAAQLAAGFAFHALNGTAFGVGYCLFFGRFGAISRRSAVVTGVGWGLFLEMFQLTLYPGWLDIRALNEFASISFSAHIVYGLVLGLGCRAALRRLFAQPGDGPVAGGVR